MVRLGTKSGGGRFEKAGGYDCRKSRCFRKLRTDSDMLISRKEFSLFLCCYKVSPPSVTECLATVETLCLGKDYKIDSIMLPGMQCMYAFTEWKKRIAINVLYTACKKSDWKPDVEQFVAEWIVQACVTFSAARIVGEPQAATGLNERERVREAAGAIAEPRKA